MSSLKEAFWGFCLLLILSCLGWYFASSSMDIQKPEQLLGSPDATILNIQVRQFNTKGNLTHLLESPKASHLAEEKSYFFTTPHIVMSDQQKPESDIRADHAQAFDKAKQIVFSGHVIIHQNPDENTLESTLKTESLVYFPDQKFATTTLAVILEQPGRIIHSEGMNAYLSEKRVELLKNAQATFQPNQG